MNLIMLKSDEHVGVQVCDVNVTTSYVHTGTEIHLGIFRDSHLMELVQSVYFVSAVGVIKSPDRSENELRVCLVLKVCWGVPETYRVLVFFNVKMK